MSIEPEKGVLAADSGTWGTNDRYGRSLLPQCDRGRPDCFSNGGANQKSFNSPRDGLHVEERVDLPTRASRQGIHPCL